MGSAFLAPQSGIIFAFAGGTHTYALRLPQPEREQAMQRGASRIYEYRAYPELGIEGSSVSLKGVGEDWVFCNFDSRDKELLSGCLPVCRRASNLGLCFTFHSQLPDTGSPAGVEHSEDQNGIYLYLEVKAVRKVFHAGSPDIQVYRCKACRIQNNCALNALYLGQETFA